MRHERDGIWILRRKIIKDYKNQTEVCIEHYALPKTDELALPNARIVRLDNVANLPKSVKLLKYWELYITGCDLQKVENLEFGAGMKPDLRNIKKLPQNLDVSQCEYVYLDGCDLRNSKKLEFAEDASVYLQRAVNLPKILDFSGCHTVYLNDADISGVKEIIFRDKQQAVDSGVYIPETKQVKILSAGSISASIKNIGNLPKIKFDIPDLEDDG